MQFPQPQPLSFIAQLIGAEVQGNADVTASGINEIHKVEEGDLVFVDHPKYYQKAIESAASFIIINAVTAFPPHKALLIVPDPFEAYLTIVQHFRPFVPVTKNISDTAVIGNGTVVMAGAVVGNNVTIGNDCVIHPNAVIMDHCVLGNRVVVGPGTVVGSDAFYYNRKKNRDAQYKRMQSCGRVVLQDDVELGANCTIDRGVTADTIIGAGTKMDNSVHVGHDVTTGKNCLLAAQVGIAGATTLEDEVILWGQVGVNKTITIGKGAEVYGQSGVASNIPGGKKYWGTPVQEQLQKIRETFWVKRIPEMWDRITKG